MKKKFPFFNKNFWISSVVFLVVLVFTCNSLNNYIKMKHYKSRYKTDLATLELLSSNRVESAKFMYAVNTASYIYMAGDTESGISDFSFMCETWNEKEVVEMIKNGINKRVPTPIYEKENFINGVKKLNILCKE